MSGTAPALIAAAAGVGFGHAIMPDHWVPLAVLGRTHRYPLARVARLSGLAGVAHVFVSVLLGGLIIAVGLQLRSTVEHAQNMIVGAVLVATGVAFIALERSGRGHSHDHAHDHDDAGEDDAPKAPKSESAERSERRRLRGLAAIMVPFGAAASPDLTILPVFLAATAAGAATAVGSLIAFALVTISTIVALTLFATFGGYQVSGRWLDRWGNAITAATLIIIGALIAAGVI